MRMMTKFLAAGAGIAAIAAAAPASAQYYGYGYNPYAASQYGYGYSPYATQYGAYGVNTQLAAQQCSAAVQARLNNRVSIGSILGSMVGLPTAATGRVLSITQVTPRRSTVSVRGLASSGRYAGYGPYGVGAYGALGYASQPDLSFRCSVDYRGYVRDVDIYRR
ncbi:MAG: hypothetical protein ACJ8D5_08905 [Sphingomicrobium sp.]